MPIVVASIWSASSACARDCGWPRPTSSRVETSTPAASSTFIDRRWSTLPIRPMPKRLPSRSAGSARSPRAAIRKGSDLFGRHHAAQVVGALGGRQQQRLERDVRHLALAGAERGQGERGLLHADELDVDAGAVEVALALGEIHHRVRDERRLHVGDDQPERLGGGRRGEEAGDQRRGDGGAHGLPPFGAFRAFVHAGAPRQRSRRVSITRSPSVIVTPISASTTTTARYSAIWKRLP